MVAEVPEHMVAFPLIAAVAVQPPPLEQVLFPLTTGAEEQAYWSLTVKE